MIERHLVDLSTVEGRAAWLALRKADVTASAVAALFGVHPYETALSLFKVKSGLELPEPDTAMLDWRLALESVAPYAVARQRPEWKLVKATEYLRDPELRLGATPDFYIEGDPRGLGVLQFKTSAPGVFKKMWTDDTPPFWVTLQNTSELMLEERAVFGAVACLIIDPWKCECPIYEVPRHPGAEARIRTAVMDFWDAVAAGNEPKPDYARDAELIAALNATVVPGKSIDLTGDNSLPIVLPELETIKVRMKADEARRKEIETEIKHKMGDAEAAVCGDFQFTHKEISRKGYEVKPTKYRQLRVTDNRPADQVSLVPGQAPALADADSF